MSTFKDSMQVGDVFTVIKNQCVNRTGATMTKGQIGMLDLLGTQAETTSFHPSGGENSVYGTITPVTQLGCDAGYPLVVCMSDSVADNEVGIYVFRGHCEVAVCDDDVSTTDIDRGDALCMLVSESATAAQEWATSATGGRKLGIAHEDAAATSATVARTVDASSHLRWCYWWGGEPGVGASDT